MLEAVIATTNVYNLSAHLRVMGLPEHALRTAEYLRRFGMELSGGVVNAPRKTGSVTRVVTDALGQTQKELDAVFEAIGDELKRVDTAALAAALTATGRVKTTLLTHQLQGLAWMLARESGFAMPQAFQAFGGANTAGELLLFLLY